MINRCVTCYCVAIEKNLCMSLFLHTPYGHTHSTAHTFNSNVNLERLCDGAGTAERCKIAEGWSADEMKWQFVGAGNKSST